MGFKSARINVELIAAGAAKALGVSEQAVFCWERGGYPPSCRRLPDIAKLYGCTIDELLSDTQATPEPAARQEEQVSLGDV